MAMSIPQALQWWRHHLGRSIQFPTVPPTCERMLAQARAAGIPVGKLYLVSRPLAAGSLGTYDRDTGDLCCHYEASQGAQGQREVLQVLLILLAGIKLQAPVPQTISQEWEAVRQAIEEGHALAQQWGYADVFSTEDLTNLLTRSVELAYCHQLAANLAGCASPWAAHAAYTALQAKRSHFDTQERFIEALGGTSAETQDNDGIVTFDRSQLRERWVATSTRSQDIAASFQELTIPSLPRSARFLRTALARVSSWTQEPVPGNISPSWYQEVADEMDLALLLRIANSWLIETNTQAALRLYCWAYGDAYPLVTGSPRIYRLSFSYEDAPLNGPPTHDLWVLFAARPTNEQRTIEGSWQAFLTSWLTWSEVVCEPLAQGLQILWMLQGGHQ